MNEILIRSKEILSQWKKQVEINNQYKKEVEEIGLKLNKVVEIQKDVNYALTALQTYKDNYKKDVVAKLEDSLNQTINSWYNGQYKFKILEETKRGNTYVRLIDENKGGNLSLICGGACSNTLQLLIAISILKLKDTNDETFIFIDERFAEFSVDKVGLVSEIVEKSLKESNIQMALVEHKYDVVSEDMDTIVYEVKMIDGKSTIFPIHNTELYNQIIDDIHKGE